MGTLAEGAALKVEGFHLRDTRRRDPVVIAGTNLTGMRIHLIGVGGCGMSGAAAILLARGVEVSGSDIVPFAGMGALVERGARIFIGHGRERIDSSLDLVVFSAAIEESNPELAAARAHGVQVIKYAELLGALMRRHRKGIAIAGTHGKSTTTAMCAFLCRRGGLEPSFLVGARSAQLGGNSGLGNGAHFIVEACEFDRSFLHLAPESAAILNIEPDHLDCYRNLEEIVEAFAQFSRNVDPNGFLLCSVDDPRAKEAATASAAPVETFGFLDGADWQAVNLQENRGCYSFDVFFHGRRLLSTGLSIPGRHNVSNALAAIGLALHAGVEAKAVAQSLPAFAGIGRRLSWCGEGQGVTVVDDYAHHPTEIRATIEAARYRYRPRRTWVIFQPHQHSRTRHFMDAFAESFDGADEIIVPDVYGAREAPKGKGGYAGDDMPCSEALVSRIRRCGGRARYLANLHAVADHLVEHVTRGDLVLTMGAGDVWKVADELVERICGPDRA